MFESWTSRSRLVLLAALTVLLTFGLIIYGYRLENVYVGDFVLKKIATWSDAGIISKGKFYEEEVTQQVSTSTRPNSSDYACYKDEPSVVLERCIACSKFELSAVKAVHCQETGFYDKINCTISGRLVLKPCYEKTNGPVHFNLFTLFCASMSAASFGFVKWRQNILYRRSYFRIQNQLNPNLT